MWVVQVSGEELMPLREIWANPIFPGVFKERGELKDASAVFTVTAMQFLTVSPDYFLILEFCSLNSVSKKGSMNLMEISYSWFKILSGYYKNNSEKDNFLQTEKSVQFSPKEEKLLNLVRKRGKKNHAYQLL